jgi:hypothetical protein
MAEQIKQFFGPTWKNAIIKVIVAITLLFVVTFIIAMSLPDLDEWGYGWPLHFLEVFGPDETRYSFNLFFLIIDILFWYLVVCLVYFYTKKK